MKQRALSIIVVLLIAFSGCQDEQLASESLEGEWKYDREATRHAEWQTRLSGIDKDRAFHNHTQGRLFDQFVISEGRLELVGLPTNGFFEVTEVPGHNSAYEIDFILDGLRASEMYADEDQPHKIYISLSAVNGILTMRELDENLAVIEDLPPLCFVSVD